MLLVFLKLVACSLWLTAPISYLTLLYQHTLYCGCSFARMRLKFTLTPLLLVVAFAAGAQNLTGIWRGYFSSSNGLYREDVRQEFYKYEVQIDQQANNGVKGVTYSYKSTIFYGKARMQGIFTVQTKNLILKETGLEELKIGDKSEPCLMTCYLEYSKIGKLEVLQGTFSSVSEKKKTDCGSGKVYLEKVTESDFELEPFLLKKKPETTAVKKKTIPVTTPAKQQPKKELPKTTLKDNTVKAPVKTSIKPPANNTTKTPAKTNNTVAATKKAPAKTNTKTTTNPPKTNNAKVADTKTSTPPPPPAASTLQKQEATVTMRKTDTPIVKWEKPPASFQGPIPKVLLERENNLVKTIVTSEHSLVVEIFDNGTIDNDTISLYHNNKLVISNGRLTYTPLRLKIDCSNEQSRHELILVAENLGEIAPNTALMVITAGKKRYEIFLTSNEKRNAKVVIEYKPD